MNIKQFLKNPIQNIISALAVRGMLQWVSDEDYIKYIFKRNMGYPLNLDNPQTYNEKLQWLKLYDRRPEYTTMVDKYAVKEYVAGIIGEEYIIPTLGVWDKFEDIDFDSLPDKFVLKCTHDSGGLVICRDKSKLDIKAARKKINKSLKRNYYHLGREWPYKNVKPRIIAESLIEISSGEELKDLKFFCFDGKTKFMYISNDRGSDPRTDFFDMDFNRLDLRFKDPNSDIIPRKPIMFEKMIELAERLSASIPHLRVDFYEADGRVYFGELTFFHNSGFFHIAPEEWNHLIGEWIKLPEKSKR